MAKTPREPDDPEMADPADLFNDEPSPRAAPKAPRNPSPAPGGGYDLEAIEEPADAGPVVPPVPIPEPTTRPKASRPRPATDSGEFDEADRPARRKAAEAPVGAVDEVWSRGAEWGPTLVVLAIGALVSLFLIWRTMSADHIGLWLLVILGCGVGMLILAYPIFITMERPVRMTPEQALRDYFGALSHRRPHFRRMWLLLSNAGRRPFASLAEFQTHWKGRLAEFRSLAGSAGPLDFRVEDFKSEKSGGKTAVDGKYTIAVVPTRGESRKPVASIRVEAGFVKGPDGMWYLDEGRLVEARPRSKAGGDEEADFE